MEFEYARYLLASASERLEFAAMHPLGRFAPISFSMAASFITELGRSWDLGENNSVRLKKLAFRLRSSILVPRLDRNRSELLKKNQLNIYLLLSHHHLTRPSAIYAALSRHKDTLFVPMVHDLIPLEYPEYSRPREQDYHLRRIATVVRFADAVLTPSKSVKNSLQDYFLRKNKTKTPIWVIPHGVHLQAMSIDNLTTSTICELGEKPYFVFLSTIEARKNHLLLLNIWRYLVEIHGANAPKLVIVGKRGWENEQALDMLERCPALQDVVEEHNALPDADVVRLLRGARALLFPSFTEGFGLPLAEALALGTPVICSDIPVFREIGGDTAHYINPLDGMGWMRRIEEFSQMTNDEARAPNRANPRPGLHWDQSISEALTQIENLATNRQTRSD
ncbi:glycosyltransferase family 4 protein [Asaia prunellae]|uniref:glycosyltransferase family 4 protein n=1 Tax=Asaia prunellae TaxID=610245 RepID=UPI001FB08A45|nr:glycosyltransferase family 1 protein [Asaia prunellae]